MWMTECSGQVPLTVPGRVFEGYGAVQVWALDHAPAVRMAEARALRLPVPVVTGGPSVNPVLISGVRARGNISR